MKRKYNLSLFLACLGGGLAGCLIAGNIYVSKKQDWDPVILMGVYFAVLSFSICLPGVISEWITTHVKGRIWEGYETRRTLFMLFGTAGLFFALGALFQFLYGLGGGWTADVDADDYIIMIDNSGSTQETDPGRERFSAIVDFAGSLRPEQRIQVSVFNSENQLVFPLNDSMEAKERLEEIFDQYGSDGNTDIQGAVMDSLDKYNSSERKAIAILLSDGAGNVNEKDIADRYLDSDILLFTIGFSNIGRDGRAVMSRIAESTGGCFFDIGDISELSSALSKIVRYEVRRMLLDYRFGRDRGKAVYMILRVLFLALLGTAIGVPLIFMLDSAELILPAMAVRGIASLAAGVMAEAGLYHSLSSGILRLMMCLCMALVVSFYSVREQTDWTFGIGGYEGKQLSSFHDGSGVGQRGSHFHEGNSAFDNERSWRSRR